MRRAAIAALLLLCALPAQAADAKWTTAGWYRIEIFPELKLRSARFASDKECRKTLPAAQDDVVECAHLAKEGDEIDRAIEFFGRAIKENPRDAAAMNYRGVLFAKKGDDEAAIAEHTNATKANPDDYWAFILRAHVYKKIGKRDEAIADLRAALGRHPDADITKQLEDDLKSLGAKP
jgi:tetratricopeptide (TPR) repeat protein